MNSTDIINLLIAKLPDPQRIEIERVYDASSGIPEEHAVHFNWFGVPIIAFSDAERTLRFEVTGRDGPSALAVALESLTKVARLNRPPDYQEGFFRKRKRGFFDPGFSKNPDHRPVSVLIGEAKASIHDAMPLFHVDAPLRAQDVDVIYHALRRAYQALTHLENFVPTRRCMTCDGYLMLIRGRQPRDGKREVCPTCAAETWERQEEEHNAKSATQPKDATR